MKNTIALYLIALGVAVIALQNAGIIPPLTIRKTQIDGTVAIKGTVDVGNTVSVEGSVDVENEVQLSEPVQIIGDVSIIRP